MSELELAPFAQLEPNPQSLSSGTASSQIAAPGSSGAGPLQDQDSTSEGVASGSGSSSSSRIVGTITQIGMARLLELQGMHGQQGVCVLDVRSVEEHTAG